MEVWRRKTVPLTVATGISAILALASTGVAWMVPEASLIALIAVGAAAALGLALAVHLGHRLRQLLAESQQAQRLNRASEDLIRGVLLASTDWLWETDADDRFTFITGQPRTTLGLPIAEMIGKPRSLLMFDPEDEQARAYRALIAARQPYREFVYRTRGRTPGMAHYIRISGQPRFSETGEFLGYRGLATDITEIIRLRAETDEVQAQLQKTVQGMPAAFAMYDASDRLVLWNRRYVDYFFKGVEDQLRAGIAYEDLLALRVKAGQMLGIDDDGRWIQTRIDQHRNPSGPQEFQSRDGRWLRIEEFRSPGGVTISFFEDITPLKEAEAALRESEERHRRLAEASPSGIVQIDTDGIILYANPALAQILGYEQPELLVGKPAQLFLADDSRQLMIQRIRDNWPSEPITREYAITRRDGSQRDIFISGVPLADQKRASRTLLCTVFDITDRKQAERQSIEARHEAELASRAKTEFLANMSHELRTPLNAIIGFCQLMRDQIFGPLGNPRYHTYTVDILDSANLLLGIINDLLDIAKIEAGRLRLDYQNLSLEDVAESAMRLVATRAQENGVTLTMALEDPHLELIADARALKQMLLNLLSNAVKFTPMGGSVTLSSSVADGWLSLCVADTGVGIEPDAIDVAMRPFGQIDSVMNRRHQGTGLGLPLTRSLAELHGGSLTLLSTPGHGTQAIIRLPLEPELSEPPMTLLAR